MNWSTWHDCGTKKKSEFPTGIEPMTSQTLGGRSIHWATRTHGNLTEFMCHSRLADTARISTVEGKLLRSLSGQNSMILSQTITRLQNPTKKKLSILDAKSPPLLHEYKCCSYLLTTSPSGWLTKVLKELKSPTLNFFYLKLLFDNVFNHLRWRTINSQNEGQADIVTYDPTSKFQE